jgi:hypothetical protein
LEFDYVIAVFSGSAPGEQRLDPWGLIRYQIDQGIDLRSA